MNDLVFFDKEGNYLNFQYDENLSLYTGDLIFHENSNDTYKTIGLYLFQRIPAFEFANQYLKFEKFQLFNENGVDFTGDNFGDQAITKIEAINNNPLFTSKWIYGQDFEKKYPLGTEIKFNQSIFEFTNTNRSYTVISSKKDAVMIISTMSNSAFNTAYSSLVGLSSSYEDKTVTALNTISIRDYNRANSISDWSEPYFSSLLYSGRKLNILNSESNDSIVTVKSTSLLDKTYWEYSLTASGFSQSSDLWIEVIMNTNLPLIYQGSLNVLESKIEFGSDVPSILKPGATFRFTSTINTDKYTVANINDFSKENKTRYYATGDQVFWNSTIYECLQSYTQSLTSSITPENTFYWTSDINYLPISSSMSAEVLGDTQIYLTTNTFNFQTKASSSTASNQNELTLAASVNQWADELKNFNITFDYKESTLKASLDFASKYATVNFYRDVLGSASLQIGTATSYSGRIFEVEEKLKQEFNKDISENHAYTVVFTDIDEFGIIIYFNGLNYQQEVQWVYNGLVPDIKKTVDKTLRAWLNTHYFTLLRLGIVARLSFTESDFPLVYCDSLSFSTLFPNIFLEMVISVGTTANYYIRHSDVDFLEIGPILKLTINGRQYEKVYGSQSLSVSEKISDWLEDYQNTLDDFGIFIRQFGNRLAFNVKESNRTLVYSVYIGKTPLAGENSFNITDRIKGNLGCLLTSNAIILGSASATFYDINGASAGDVSFATGQIVSVNNSIYPYNNQDYNLIEVNQDRLVLSYQGPFWGGTSSGLEIPDISIFYDTGFAESLTAPSLSGFDAWKYEAFSTTKAFDAYLGYSQSEIVIPSDSEAISDITDLVFVPQTSRVYVFGSNLKIFDAETDQFLETIKITGISTPVKVIYNSKDSFLYLLTYNKIYRVNAITYEIVNEISLGYTATSKTDLDIALNSTTGDLYVSCTSASSLKRIAPGATSSTSIYSSSATYKMAYDDTNNRLFVITASDVVREFNCNTHTQISTYTISGSTTNNSIVFNGEEQTIYVMGSTLTTIFDSETTSYSTISAAAFNSLFYDNSSGRVLLSRSSLFSAQSGGSVIYNESITKYGDLLLNSNDGRVYLAAQNANGVYIIDSDRGVIVNQIEGLGAYVTKMVSNLTTGAIWAILPSSNKLIQINPVKSIYYRNSKQVSYQNSFLSEGSQYGSLSEQYSELDSLWLKTRDYIRKPRFGFEGDPQAQFIWTWEDDSVPEIFLYDFSGTQLETTGVYAYTGEKPLSKVYLNKKPNRDLTKVALPEYQQTIFPSITNNIDYINSNYNLSFLPQPLECFIGYKADDEGTHLSRLQLFMRENIDFTITSTSTNDNIISLYNVTSRYDFYGEIVLATSSTDNFLYNSDGTTRGLRAGQNIMLTFSDTTNTRNKYLSYNNGINLTIRAVFLRSIVVDFNDLFFEQESTVLEHNGTTTYLAMTIKVLDKEVARIRVKGQTEIEDDRYRINLSNVGKMVAADETFIFKTYDINEQGIDWNFLNQKRKEMLLVNDQIYPYIGSYKAIINAINYFGYNDLEFYEYYRNIDFESKDFGKLVKIELPDIFDNTVPGWKENDWIKWTLPNPKFEDTNLFNLTYRITDREGNNVLLYSLPEVITKLAGLKKWLQSNVIPITHKIYDITGRADFVQTNSIVHKSYAVTILKTEQSMSPVDFALNEAYLMPVNSGSSVYNCVIDFTIVDKDYKPEYFELRIKTYKTYPEWQPFKTYSTGQIVSYYQVNYESTRDFNRLNNPRKYRNQETWSANFDYTFGQIVEYNKSYYSYNATQSSLSLTASNPLVDNINGEGLWTDITQWRVIDYLPVQNYKEFRTATHSFNFTVDSNIDPYIVIEVTSDNGYGLTWTSKKSYEIRGILNMELPQEEVDVPGPIKIWDPIV